MNQKNNGSGKRQEIKIADNIPGGDYANLAQIGHNKDEFQVMFASVMGGSGRVVSKVMTSPGHYKRMLKAMQDNLKKYEEKFGAIEESKSPQSIGFQDRK